MFNVKLHNVALRDTIVYDIHVVDQIQSILDTSCILVPFDNYENMQILKRKRDQKKRFIMCFRPESKFPQ